MTNCNGSSSRRSGTTTRASLARRIFSTSPWRESRIAARERIVVAGIGNTDRGDDAVGRIVARRLRARLPEAVHVFECAGDASGIMEALAGARTAILVDAVRSGAEPGTVHRIDVHSRPLPARWFSTSTHGFGVAEAVELARALDRLPPAVVFYGVEAGSLAPGAPLTPAVRASVEDVAARIVEDIARHENSL